MEPWIWLAVSLVGFALLQVALYRYFRQGETSNEPPAGKPGARADTGRDTATPPGENRFDSARETRPTDTDADGVHCKHCGARNERDAVFTHCRRCAEPLQ